VFSKKCLLLFKLYNYLGILNKNEREYEIILICPKVVLVVNNPHEKPSGTLPKELRILLKKSGITKLIPDSG
jgi:hypothetical protein